MYDLSQIANGTSSGLCGVSADDSCCRCMKKKTTKKTCKDTGCEKKFEGKGIGYTIIFKGTYPDFFLLNNFNLNAQQILILMECNF